jgi:hypothetical protein
VAPTLQLLDQRQELLLQIHAGDQLDDPLHVAVGETGVEEDRRQEVGRPDLPELLIRPAAAAHVRRLHHPGRAFETGVPITTDGGPAKLLHPRHGRRAIGSEVPHPSLTPPVESRGHGNIRLRRHSHDRTASRQDRRDDDAGGLARRPRWPEHQHGSVGVGGQQLTLSAAQHDRVRRGGIALVAHEGRQRIGTGEESLPISAAKFRMVEALWGRRRLGLVLVQPPAEEGRHTTNDAPSRAHVGKTPPVDRYRAVTIKALIRTGL